MIDYLRHPNGRGKLFDDAEANRGTYIDRTSSASGSAKLRDCILVDYSVAEGECQIYGGKLDNSLVRGSTIIAGHPLIRDCIVDCNEVSGSPVITLSDLTGHTEVCDSPIIRGSGLHDAIVYGSPRIDGARFVTGRIHEGHWTRAPKHIKLPWCELTECIDGKLLLDCRCRPVAYWLRHGAKLARRWEWGEDMITVTLETIGREFPQPPTFLYDPTKIESYRACAIKL